MNDFKLHDDGIFHRVGVVGGAAGEDLQAESGVKVDGGGVRGADFQREGGAWRAAGMAKEGLHELFGMALVARGFRDKEREEVRRGMRHDAGEQVAPLPCVDGEEDVVGLGEQGCGLFRGEDGVLPVGGDGGEEVRHGHR